MANELKNIIKKTSVYSAYQTFRKEKKFHLPKGIDAKHIWAFNSGDTFTGNPKWLFLYINKYRPDIYAYWICNDQQTIDFVRSLGFHAFLFKEENCSILQRKTGVYVVEQVKEIPPKNMRKATLLNLYHGVGCKTVEKKVDYGFLMERIAKKYITHNEYYQKNMLFLVTSPLMEEHFIRQCDLKNHNIVRGGYPRCIYQKYFEKVVTFDHDLRSQKGLSKDAKIAAYVPTYRDNSEFDFWANAIPEFDTLVEKLEAQNMLLILKVHPKMAQDPRYLRIQKQYQNCPWLLFWDNRLDFYEIFDQIDLGIIDYSSIFYDMMAGGVSHFIRYFFDYEDHNMRDTVFDLKEMTCGTLCSDFSQLLQALEHYEEEDSKEFQRIHQLFWSYSSKDSMDEIIRQTLEFTPKQETDLPILYSFDIFDTLIARKVLEPAGIFYGVQEKMRTSHLNFPAVLIDHYPEIRSACESNVREYYRRTLQVRKSDHREISFEEIFQRIQDVYEINDKQMQMLMDWELELEYENSIPIPQNIQKITELVSSGETVVLISDMYLSLEFVQKLLYKASPLLADLPLFLSREYGVQKTTRKLFLEVYKSFDTYNFKKWIHCGDNPFADGECPEKLGICTTLTEHITFNDYEHALAESLNSYDGYLLAGALARFRQEHSQMLPEDGTPANSEKDYFVYAYASLYFVPYVYWAVHHALKKGTQCLYFISRDGHLLKTIADALIQAEHLTLKTKYIYGSRAAWRVPSFIDKIDEEFFYGFGNFAAVSSYKNLLKALSLTDQQFTEFFPDFDFVKTADHITPEIRKSLNHAAKNSSAYQNYLLDYAAQKRTIVEDYFRQEIDFSESFAFVEYWGRGYTQDCFARLLHDTQKCTFDVPFYYTRSIYPTQGHYVRYNFTSNPTPLIFTEALFANIPYRSIEEYRRENGTVLPCITPISCDESLFQSLNQNLARFAQEFAEMHLQDPEKACRELYDFSLCYYEKHQDDPLFVRYLAPLIDAAMSYGDKKEFAPKITPQMIQRLKEKEKVQTLTSSVPMSVARSEPELAKQFLELLNQ